MTIQNTVPFKWLAVNEFHRLSQFAEECEFIDTEGLLNQLMIIFSYNGYLVLAFMLFLTVYDRTTFHVMAGIGIPFTQMCITLYRDWMPGYTRTGSHCSNLKMEEPNRPTALISYSIVYYLMFHLWLENRYSAETLEKAMWAFIMILSTVVAQMHCRLAEWEEVAEGIVFGAVCGAFMSWIMINWMVPAFSNKRVQYLLHLLKIETDRIS